MSKKNEYLRSVLSERDYSELVFAQLYAKSFHHGTDGHNRLLLIDKLSRIIGDLTNVPETPTVPPYNPVISTTWTGTVITNGSQLLPVGAQNPVYINFPSQLDNPGQVGTDEKGNH